MRVAGCRKDAKKLDEVNEEFIYILAYLAAFVLFLHKFFRWIYLGGDQQIN